MMMREHDKIQVEKWGVRATVCDGCGKRELGEPRDWLHLNFGHNDWDGAGETSQDELDACSASCLIKVLGEIADEYGEQKPPTLSVWVGRLPYHIVRSLGDLKDGGA